MSVLVLTSAELALIHRIIATTAIDYLGASLAGRLSDDELNDKDFIVALAEKLAEARASHAHRRRRVRQIAEVRDAA